eukprot:13627112-Alexandrium_andersonii.AAC.1
MPHARAGVPAQCSQQLCRPALRALAHPPGAFQRCRAHEPVCPHSAHSSSAGPHCTHLRALRAHCNEGA